MEIPHGVRNDGGDSIRRMFNAIAPRYDLLNHLLSLGTDRRWRRAVIEEMKLRRPRHILDVATGTADLAIAAMLAGPEKVTGIDVAENMLLIGREKVRRLNLTHRIELLNADALQLPFDDCTFDAAMVAFGVRNFSDPEKGMTEIHRVLKPAGTLTVLEFSHPRLSLFRQLFRLYFHHILPAVGLVFSGHPSAYRYLPDTVKNFPDGNEFLIMMKKAGFTRPQFRPLSLGIATIYIGEK